jgi:molecular chaperone HtpG
MAATQVMTFQAETKELLGLMIHSLYTQKEIFLRELISNASDALDRLRFESLTAQELLEGNDKFEIRLDVDPAARTLTVSDSGIGMSREEVIANIGTIAKSGTADLRRTIDAASAAQVAESIGQFGVGFYSAFMVADRVKLLTRRAGQTVATEWESDGGGTYEIRVSQKSERGTSITLYLKQPDPEAGIEDYTDYWRLSSIVKLHSDFINYPIIAKKERSQTGADASAPDKQIIEENVLNSMKPIWKRSTAEVTQQEYDEFYRHLSHDWTEPLKTIHFKAEGTFEYEALLYVPARAPHDLYYVSSEVGLRLFAKRVMIMEKCADLLPRYLRFVRGVVDAADLPLNISRQRLQQDRHITLIRKRLTRKVLDTFRDLLAKQHEEYLKLWAEFGRVIKEGVSSDFDNRGELQLLLLFQSSQDSEKLTTLKDYVGRMRPDQEQILYLTGDSRAAVENSPHLEAVKEKGFEVLYMVDTVDELVLQHLTEFEGKKLKSLGKGIINLGTDDEKRENEKALKEKEEEYKPLLEYLQKELDEHVKQVRLTTRLTTSPVCLVVEEHDYSPMLERALHAGNAPKQRRVFELNPKHSLVSRIQQRYAADPQDSVLRNAAEVLFGLALLAEGSELPNPVGFNRAATELLGQVV